MTRDFLPFLSDRTTSIESSLGLPPDFLRRLLSDDDWSFAIKGSALAEAAVTQLLVTALGRAELEPALLSTPLLGKSGKTSMVRALGLIDATQERFVKRLAELRNSLVHDVRRTSFTFDAHVKALNRGEAPNFLRDLLFLWPSQRSEEAAHAGHLSPFVWLHLIAFLDRVLLARRAEEQSQQVAELERDIGRYISQPDDPRADEYT